MLFNKALTVEEMNNLYRLGFVGIITVELPKFLEQAEINFQFECNTTDLSTPTWSLTEGTLPEGLVLTSDGRLSGVTETSFIGNITVTATQLDETTHSKTFFLHVLEVDAASPIERELINSQTSTTRTGSWWDIDDLSTLYTDVDGLVPVTGVGDEVRRVNDKWGTNDLRVPAGYPPYILGFNEELGRHFLQCSETTGSGLDRLSPTGLPTGSQPATVGFFAKGTVQTHSNHRFYLVMTDASGGNGCGTMTANVQGCYPAGWAQGINNNQSAAREMWEPTSFINRATGTHQELFTRDEYVFTVTGNKNSQAGRVTMGRRMHSTDPGVVNDEMYGGFITHGAISDEVCRAIIAHDEAGKRINTVIPLVDRTKPFELQMTCALGEGEWVIIDGSLPDGLEMDTAGFITGHATKFERRKVVFEVTIGEDSYHRTYYVATYANIMEKEMMFRQSGEKTMGSWWDFGDSSLLFSDNNWTDPVEGDNSPVRSILDKMGNNHLVASNQTTPPKTLFRNSIQRGVMNFDGSSAFVTATPKNLPHGNMPGCVLAFMVYTGSGYQWIYNMGSNNGAARRRFLGFYNNSAVAGKADLSTSLSNGHDFYQTYFAGWRRLLMPNANAGAELVLSRDSSSAYHGTLTRADDIDTLAVGGWMKADGSVSEIFRGNVNEVVSLPTNSRFCYSNGKGDLALYDYIQRFGTDNLLAPVEVVGRWDQSAKISFSISQHASLGAVDGQGSNGRRNHWLIQTTASKKPTVIADEQLGNRRVLNFDGVNDELVDVDANRGRTFGRNSPRIWCMALIRVNAIPNDGVNKQIFFAPNNGTSTRFATIIRNVGEEYTVGMVCRRLDADGAQEARVVVPKAELIDKWALLYTYMDYATATATIWFNGRHLKTSPLLTPGNTSNTQTSTSSRGLALGQLAGSTTHYYANFRMGRIIADDSATMSLTQVNKLFGSIAHEYDVAHLLPDNHPFKYGPPYKTTPDINEDFTSDSPVIAMRAGLREDVIGLAPAADEQPSIGIWLTTGDIAATITIYQDSCNFVVNISGFTVRDDLSTLTITNDKGVIIGDTLPVTVNSNVISTSVMICENYFEEDKVYYAIFK